MTRAALTIAQNAAVKLGLDEPAELFASTDRTAVELRRALIEAADQIVRAHDWQVLKRLAVHTGDGTTTEFALPTDWLRMPKDARVWSTRWQHALNQITPEDWLHLDIRDFDPTVGAWTIYGGNFVYVPALASGELAKFFYVSNAVVAPGRVDGENKPQFTLDDDTFRLDDRVLELMLVAVWRAQKSLDYSEELSLADQALSRAIEADKGARILEQRSRSSLDAKLAFPLSVTT